jgi:hypothetical protein
MASPQLTPRFTVSARVEELARDPSHYRLTIPSGGADSYRLAQLDDYSTFARQKFPHHSLTISLSARTSSDSIPGTWGFGLWNDPFGLSLGFGGNPFRLPALPNAVWFFGASEENYLSFKEPRASSSLRSAQREIAANGFLAQTFRSPKFHPLLILAGLALPFSRKVARWLLSRVIDEDGIQLWDQGESPWRRGDTRSRNATSKLVESKGVDPTDWHRYRLEWSPKRVSFEVDYVRVFESAASPNPPLGLVIWIDNQYAAFTPEGKIGFGVLEGKEEWLEIKELEIK